MIDIVDFHSHILPGADHGSASVGESLDQLKLASLRGVQRIIATPHFYPQTHDVDTFLERRDISFLSLAASLPSDSPKVIVGAEVLMCYGIENMPGLSKLFIPGTQSLLLELPYSDFQLEYVRSVSNLVSSGVNVILAHADRYPSENIAYMLDAGANIQLNADALTSMYIPKHIREWLDSDKVIAIGSDIHGTDARAYRHFNTAVSKISRYIPFIKQFSDEIWKRATEDALT